MGTTSRMNTTKSNNHTSGHNISDNSTDTTDTTTGTSERNLLTVEQAADLLQLSTSSIRSYIRQGTLKAFRVAGLRKVLIPRQGLLKLLEPT